MKRLNVAILVLFFSLNIIIAAEDDSELITNSLPPLRDPQTLLDEYDFQAGNQKKDADISTINAFFTRHLETDFRSINKTLGINLERTIITIHKTEHDLNKKRDAQILKMGFKTANVKFVTDDDFLILGYVMDADWGRADSRIILAYVKENGKYKMAFKFLDRDGSASNAPTVIDIDGDGQMEIVMEYSATRHITDGWLDVHKYVSGEFKRIFHEPIAQGEFYWPYSFDSEYYFAKNEKNPQLLDLVLEVQTHIKDPVPGYEEDVKRTLKGKYFPQPRHEQVRFIFDGEKYVQEHPAYNYKEYIDLDFQK